MGIAMYVRTYSLVTETTEKLQDFLVNSGFTYTRLPSINMTLQDPEFINWKKYEKIIFYNIL